MKIRDLTPGAIIHQPGPSGLRATFVAAIEHPLFDGLAMVIWKMEDGEWMHDALSWAQDIGEPEPQSIEVYKYNLRCALLHPSQWGDPPK